MWDRFRSAAGTGGGGITTASASAPGGRAGPSGADYANMSFSPLSSGPSSGGSGSAPQSSNHNYTNSWQPRSSVIAARQQRQQRQASVDSSTPYHFHGKTGPPPPRPPRNFSEVSPPAPLSQRSNTTPLPTPYAPRHAHRDSTNGRPPSSVYSQPSPLHTDFRLDRHVNVNVRYGPSPDEVSPPSSPELLSPGHEPNHDISPIDEEDRIPFPPRPRPDQKMSAQYTLPSQQRAASRQSNMPGPPGRSNLPMMRRERRQQQRDAEAAANRVRSSGQDGSSQDNTDLPSQREPTRQLRGMESRERLGSSSPTADRIPRAIASRERLKAPVRQERSGHYPTDKPRGQKDPRWDPMTGEIASGGDGRPSQVKPVEFARGLGISTMSSKTPRSPSSPEQLRGGGARSPVAPRDQLPTSATDPAATAFLSNRPGWRGASGRTAIVDPVQDNTAVEPLKIPPKSARRASPNPESSPRSGGGGRGGGGGNDIAMASPPISPETQTHQIGAAGGGAWQGPQTVISTVSGPAKSSKMSNTLSALNTIRKIMPSSSSRNANASPRSSSNPTTNPAQGYPSPPLSGSPTPVNANTSANNHPMTKTADLATTNLAANTVTATTHHQQQPSSAASPTPTPPPPPPPTTQRSSSGPIRRKEIGSHPPSAHLTANNNPSRHRPHDSFSSSVYSRPSEDHDDSAPSTFALNNNIRQSSNPIRLNTKELPFLPGPGNTESPNNYVQPPSRFSVTTYATSAHTDSPRDSVDVDAPPLPTPPKDIIMGPPQPQPSPDNAESVLARARPKLRGGENKWEDEEGAEAPIKISLTKAWMSTAGANSAGINAQNSPPQARKPKGVAGPKGPRQMIVAPDRDSSDSSNNKDGRVGGGFLGFFTSQQQRSPTTAPSPTTPGLHHHHQHYGSGDSTPNSRPGSILSVDKALPLAPPPETTSTSMSTTGGRIEQLNAQLSALGNRRININRAVEQMTKLMPQDNLLATDAVARKREAEKRKIEELERELADIQREEHELGMKLHRAYKKLDSQTEYEPTTLWVRRAAR